MTNLRFGRLSSASVARVRFDPSSPSVPLLSLKEGVDPKALTPREWLARNTGEVAERRD